MSEHDEYEEGPNEREVAALLAHATIAAAAESIGVAPRTLARRLQDSSFVAALQQQRRAILSHAFTTCANACSDALTVLVAIANDKDTPPSARVAACSKLLDHALRAQELEEIGPRLAALEAAARDREST